MQRNHSDLLQQKVINVKNSTVFCTLIAAALGVQLLYAHGVADKSEQIADESEYYLEDNEPMSGMFFSSDNVVEEYEYDDAYCLLYDDADANMFNVEICVDLETYERVIDSDKTGTEMVGTLVLNDDYSYDGIEVFTFMDEPEYEMAEASAKFQCQTITIQKLIP